MGKYYIMFCECGRIHFLDNKKIVDICENGETVLHVCTNCGKTHLIGLEDHGNSEFWWYCYRVKRTVNLDVEKERIKEVMCTQGTPVFMKNCREYANAYVNGEFIYWEYNSDTDYVRDEEVDTKALIISIDDDEKCEELSNLMCKIHWAGTKFEKDYNK